MSDCRECRRLRLKYENCAGKDWYSERDIVYCPHQIIWVLEHLSELKTGFWPEKPLTEEQERNYLPSLGKVATIISGGHGNASLERILCIVADVESRIKKTGWDGDVLRTYYCGGYDDISELANEMGEPIDKIERAIKNSLRYVRGWRVRRHRDNTEITYKEFRDGHQLPDLRKQPIYKNKSKLVTKA